MHAVFVLICNHIVFFHFGQGEAGMIAACSTQAHLSTEEFWSSEGGTKMACIQMYLGSMSGDHTHWAELAVLTDCSTVAALENLHQSRAAQ